MTELQNHGRTWQIQYSPTFSKQGYNKNMCQLFCHEESIYGISKSSIQGSEVMLGIKKHNVNAWKHRWMNKPEALYPSNFFEVGGIKTKRQEAHGSLT